MNIELSSGKKFNNVSADELKEKLQLLKSGEDFLILEDNDNYIQCAVSGSSLLFEYRDNTGHYTGSSIVSYEKGEEILVLYINRDNGWKNLTSWEEGDSYEGADATGQKGSSASVFSSSESSSGGSDKQEQNDDPLSMGGLLNTLKKTAKKEVKRAVEKKTSGLVKDVFRKFTK